MRIFAQALSNDALQQIADILICCLTFLN